jgi:hypothetical protein
MKKRSSVILIIVLLIGGICAAQTNSGGMKVYPYAFPLKVSQGNRYLTDQSNQPFFWSGDAAWSLIAQLSSKDADLYLDNRMGKGFTVIMVSLIEHKFCNNAPSNFYGELPFTGKPFITPNERYFAHADSVIESAYARNIAVLLAPLYLGYDCKDEGWCAEVKEASPDDLYSWGQYLGRRYEEFNNIIWLIGGDTDPSPVKDKVEAMVKGIREYDTNHLFSAHNQPESMAVTPWQGSSWLTINNVYSYDSLIYKRFRKAYELKPAMPYFQIESAYENEHNSTPRELRSYAYWAVLSGSMGHLFGNCPIWHFGSAKTWCNTTDWKREMNDSGSVSMDYLQRLFRSRRWQTLVPDYTGSIIKKGNGTMDTKDHVVAAETSDGNTIIAYLPSGKNINVDISKIRGTRSKCWWYNPSNGKTVNAGTYNNSGIRNFAPLTDGDWVLVIDNVDAKYRAPGTESLIKAAKIRK